jgi:hypothetical protein
MILMNRLLGLFIIALSAYSFQVPGWKWGETKAALSKVEYCLGDADIAILTASVQVQLSNSGRRPIFVYRGPREVEWLAIAQGESEALKGRYIKELAPSAVPPLVSIPEVYPNKVFGQLSPGRTTTIVTSLWFPVSRRDMAAEELGIVPSGVYWIVFRMRMWPYSATKPEDRARRWRSSGELAWENIRVGPIRIEVDANPAVRDCSSPAESLR